MILHMRKKLPYIEFEKDIAVCETTIILKAFSVSFASKAGAYVGSNPVFYANDTEIDFKISVLQVPI